MLHGCPSTRSTEAVVSGSRMVGLDHAHLCLPTSFAPPPPDLEKEDGAERKKLEECVSQDSREWEEWKLAPH